MFSGEQPILACRSYEAAVDAIAMPDELTDHEPDADSEPNCDHNWELDADEQGDPREAHLYGDYSCMVCTECGETRDITDADRRKWKDNADHDRWERRKYR